MADVILAALVLVPVVITVLLKSSGPLSFLSLCAGFTVISFASTDIKDLTGQLNFSIDNNILNLVLIGLPLLVTLLITRRSFKGKSGYVIHGLIALATGGLLALIAIPLLSETVNADFAKSDLWENLQKFQASIVGAGAFLSLLWVWVHNLKKPHDKDKKKHKK